MAWLWCFWKGVKLYRSSRTNAFLHWEKEKKGKGGSGKKREENRSIVITFGVTCCIRMKLRKKKKKRNIASLYYNFQHGYYSICILSNNPLLINSTNFTESLIIRCRCTFFPSGSRFQHYTCKCWMRNGTKLWWRVLNGIHKASFGIIILTLTQLCKANYDLSDRLLFSWIF